MASAAAVAADNARSPEPNDIGRDKGLPGEITSGIYSKEEGLPGVNGEDEDDEDELPSNPLRGRRPPNGNREEDDDGDGLDLFGDDEEAEKPARRQLDDEELDSGDDMERRDRVADEPEEQQFDEQEKLVIDLEIPRQPAPEPSDGEMYLLKMPTFMSIEPQAWDHKTFQPPTTDHHSRSAPSETFSAYNTALTTIRWRHSPSNPSQLQSNARINRWSDGSLTLQLASDPTTQYEIDGNSLAPPQRNPLKPTPTSIQAGAKGGRQGAVPEEKYDHRKDAFTYLVRPYQESETLMISNKITAGLTIKQSGSVNDDAIEQLQAALTKASKNGATGMDLQHIDEDPEKARFEAEKAMKQKEQADKRRQAAMDRDAARSNKALGRSGLSSNRYSGLNVGMLEDDEGGESNARGRPSPNKGRKAPRRRRNSEYSDDEDFGRRRFTKEDEYDEEDDFLAPSDEEEVVEDDEDPDDGIVEAPRGGGGGGGRERTPKRDRDAVEEDDEADAPGEEDDEDEAVQQQARTKRRRVVDDEDEDEE